MTKITSKVHYIKFEQSSLLLASSNLKIFNKNTPKTPPLNFHEKLNILQNYFEYLLVSAEKQELPICTRL